MSVYSQRFFFNILICFTSSIALASTEASTDFVSSDQKIYEGQDFDSLQAEVQGHCRLIGAHGRMLDKHVKQLDELSQGITVNDDTLATIQTIENKLRRMRNLQMDYREQLQQLEARIESQKTTQKILIGIGTIFMGTATALIIQLWSSGCAI